MKQLSLLSFLFFHFSVYAVDPCWGPFTVIASDGSEKVLSADGFYIEPEKPRPFLGTTDAIFIDSLRRSSRQTPSMWDMGPPPKNDPPSTKPKKTVLSADGFQVEVTSEPPYFGR